MNYHEDVKSWLEGEDKPEQKSEPGTPHAKATETYEKVATFIQDTAASITPKKCGDLLTEILEGIPDKDDRLDAIKEFKKFLTKVLVE